jgi:hypothetical protein
VNVSCAHHYPVALSQILHLTGQENLVTKCVEFLNQGSIFSIVFNDVTKFETDLNVTAIMHANLPIYVPCPHVSTLLLGK